MRSRSASRRSAPSGGTSEGSLSRMRSRSAHREDRHSWVSPAVVTVFILNDVIWTSDGRYGQNNQNDFLLVRAKTPQPRISSDLLQMLC